MTEQLLIQKIRKGDDAAFESLFRQYFKVLTVYALRYLNDLDIAQDLTQDVFVRLYEQRTELKIHTSLKSYLYTIVRNRCLDYIKTNRIHNDHKQIIQNEHTGSQADHSDVVLEVELQERIFSAINELPEQRQKIFRLSRLEGKSNQEIADLLSITKRTVETHISNALKNLKTQLSDYLVVLIISIITYFP